MEQVFFIKNTNRRKFKGKYIVSVLESFRESIDIDKSRVLFSG
jgi:hypothetical protein